MKLTETQRQTISRLEDELSELLWDEVYYNNPDKDVISLYEEGVELNFHVEINPYVGIHSN